VVAEVGDLVAAAEAGGHDYILGRRAADGGEEHALAAGLAYLVVALLVAERARHPAASAVQDAELQPLHLAQHLARELHADERLPGGSGRLVILYRGGDPKLHLREYRRRAEHYGFPRL
jgi:hypothetical protein